MKLPTPALHVQVDILSNDEEVQEVVEFVSDNAKRVLNVDAARVIPISSRLALDAKLAVDDGSAGKVTSNFQLHHYLIASSLLEQACMRA